MKAANLDVEPESPSSDHQALHTVRHVPPAKQHRAGERDHGCADGRVVPRVGCGQEVLRRHPGVVAASMRRGNDGLTDSEVVRSSTTSLLGSAGPVVPWLIHEAQPTAPRYVAARRSNRRAVARGALAD